MASPNGDTLFKVLLILARSGRQVAGAWVDVERVSEEPGCGVHANRVSHFSESIVAETVAVTMVL
jgi:hypothetical protein